MPQLAFAQNTIRIAVRQTYAGAKVVNIFHLYWNGASGDFLGPTDVQVAVDGLANAFKTQFLPQMSSLLTMQGADAVDLSSATGSSASSAVTGSGGLGSAAAPANVACCVSWKSIRHYRGGHPRTYLSGMPDLWLSTTDSRNFTGGAVTALQTAAGAFRTACNALTSRGGNFALSVVHYGPKNAPYTTPLVDPITGASVNARIDSQRRRLGK
jgi:hypothetical protein